MTCPRINNPYARPRVFKKLSILLTLAQINKKNGLKRNKTVRVSNTFKRIIPPPIFAAAGERLRRIPQSFKPSSLFAIKPP
jgi:hypothetical protein